MLDVQRARYQISWKKSCRKCFQKWCYVRLRMVFRIKGRLFYRLNGSRIYSGRLLTGKNINSWPNEQQIRCSIFTPLHQAVTKSIKTAFYSPVKSCESGIPSLSSSLSFESGIPSLSSSVSSASGVPSPSESSSSSSSGMPSLSSSLSTLSGVPSPSASSSLSGMPS